MTAFALGTTSVAALEAEIPPVDVAAEPPPELKALAESCAAHKFETMVIAEGRRRPISVKICGKEGQSDADWLVTLKDSLEKTRSNAAMEPAVRDKIVAALRTEIDRLEGAAAMASRTVISENAAIDLPSGPVVPRETAPQYSTLPPLPAPKRTAPVNLAGNAAGVATEQGAEPLARLNLRVRCGLPGETFDSCAILRGETRLLVQAGEDIAAGTVMRFVRDNDLREEIELGALKKGASLRYKLPGRVCRGVFRGRVEVQLVTKGRVTETLGPYSLNCRPSTAVL